MAVDNCGYNVIPHVAIHPSSINLYSTVEWYERKRFTPKHNHLIESDKKHNGKVSGIAGRKITKAVDYLLFMANDKILPSKIHGKVFKFKIAFITLTLPSPQVHPDNVIKEQCLNQFLVEVRKKYNVVNYIWRAEKQKNGSIHFHILLDKFLPWSELRDLWNRIVNKLGYVERYRDSMRAFHSGGFRVRENLLKSWDYKSQVNAYQAGKANDWSSPNSTDIHSIKKVGDVRKYVMKYTSKDDVNGVIEGRIWGCNFELSNIKGAVEIADAALSSEIAFLCSKFPDKVYKSEYFSVIHVSVQELYNLNCVELFKLFSQFLIQKFNYHIQIET